MSIKKYTYLFVFFSCFIAITLSSANYLVDPYMLFNADRISGFNEKKAAVSNYSALYKPYNVTHIQPQTIIVGNSRPEMGIDPESSCWPARNGTVYNLTFPGLSVHAQVGALFHAVAAGDVRHILLGVDFSDFLYSREKVKEVNFPEHGSDFFDRLLVDEGFEESGKSWLKTIQDYSSTLFSLNTLFDSIFTVISQSPGSVNRTSLGFNPALDYDEIVHREGVWVLFEQTLGDLNKRFSKPDQTIYDSKQWSLELKSIERAIQLANERDIQLILFMNPYHYTYLEHIHDAGYWNEFEDFKKSLTKLVSQYDGHQVALWDFSLYSKYTVSSIPKKTDNNQTTNWFWEPAHYKSEFGELLLAKMLDMNCIDEDLEQIGVKLNNINIEDHLLQQKMQRLSFLQQLNRVSSENQ